MSAPTPSQTIGPFFRGGFEWLASTAGGLSLTGRILDGEGQPVADAVVELWQPAAFARALTDGEGVYRATVDKPAPVDDDQAPHLDVSVFARGLLQRVVTRLYFPDEPKANGADPVLAGLDGDRRGTLVAAVEGDGLRFDIRLQGPDETVFFAW